MFFFRKPYFFLFSFIFFFLGPTIFFWWGPSSWGGVHKIYNKIIFVVSPPPQKKWGGRGVSEFPSFLSFRASKFPNFRVSQFPSFQVSKSPSFRVSELPIYLVSEFPSFRVTEFRSLQVCKFPKEGGKEDQWEAWNWSCDLRANERPWKKLHPMAQTYTQTDILTNGHGDSMTNSAQRGQVGENYQVNIPNKIYKIKSIKNNLLNQIFKTKRTKPGLPN